MQQHPQVCRKARRTQRVSLTTCPSAVHCSTSAAGLVCPSSRVVVEQNLVSPSWGVWWGVRCLLCVQCWTSLAGVGQGLPGSLPNPSRAESLKSCLPWRRRHAWRSRGPAHRGRPSLSPPCALLLTCPQSSPWWTGWWCPPYVLHLFSTMRNKEVDSQYDN